MTQQLVAVQMNSSNKDYYEPWRKFIPKPTTQRLFYFVSTEVSSNNQKKYNSHYLWKSKEIVEIVAFTHPIVALMCDSVYESYNEDKFVWLVEGVPEDGVCSLEGRVGLKKATVVKRTTFRLSMHDAFKVAGGSVMKIHDDRIFATWFIDSIGDRNDKNDGGNDISTYGRKLAERYKDTCLDKSYEYLAASHMAEYKSSKEQEHFKRRKLGQSFLYSIHSAYLRKKEINVSEICEKTLTMIRSEEKSCLPIKVKEEWSENSLYS